MSQPGKRKTKFSGRPYITKIERVLAYFMRILNSCVAELPIWLFWIQILKFWLFLTPLPFLGNKKNRIIWLGSGKTLSELHIHYKYLATRVYYHAGCTENCKYFIAALKMIDVIDKKQTHDRCNYGERKCF